MPVQPMINETISQDRGSYFDPALTEKNLDLWIRKKPKFFQIKIDFSKTFRSYIELHCKIKTRNLI